MDHAAVFMATQLKRCESDFHLARAQLNAARSLKDLVRVLHHKPHVPVLVRHMSETRKLSGAFDLAGHAACKYVVGAELAKLVPGRSDFVRSCGYIKEDLRHLMPHAPLVAGPALRQVCLLDAAQKALTPQSLPVDAPSRQRPSGG